MDRHRIYGYGGDILTGFSKQTGLVKKTKDHKGTEGEKVRGDGEKRK